MKYTVHERKEIAEKLLKEAEYARNSHNRDQVCETYGKAKMARILLAIRFEDFKKLNQILVVECLNNGDWRRGNA